MSFHRLAVIPLTLVISFGCSPPPAGDACEAVDCGSNGHCATRAGVAECVCDVGFRPDGLGCVTAGTGGGSATGGGAAMDGGAGGGSGGGTAGGAGGGSTTGPCANNPCAATGKTCSESNGFAVCSCPAGFADFGGGCVMLSACAGNPCTQSNKNVCYVVDGGAACLCNPGYQPGSGGSCSQIMTMDAGACTAVPHNLPGDDAFEPDECPSSSKLYTAPMNHTLTAGDVDWSHAASFPRQIMRVAITGSTVPLSVDVFDSNTFTPLAADHTGASNPSFLVSASNSVAFARVTAAVGTDTGPYVLTITDAGYDDFVNTPGSASVVTSFSGNVQYAGDEDWAKFNAVNRHTYIFQVGSSFSSNLRANLYDLDGATLRKTLDTTLSANQYTYARARVDGTFYVQTAARTPGSTGNFTVNVQDLGIDDHGDVVTDADPLPSTTMTLSGTFERSGDVDVFAFPVVAGRAYRLTCYQQYGCYSYVRDSAGTVVVQQSNNYSSVRTVAAIAVTSGTWNVSFSTSSNDTGAYVYQLEDLGSDDHGMNLMMPTGLTAGTPVSGRIEVPNDRDVFGFTGTAGTLYRVTCASASPASCRPTVRDPAGTTVGLPGYSPSGTQDVIVRAPAAGTYTVDVTATTSLDYSISVAVAPADDVGDTAAAASALAPGTPRAGVVSYQGDVDFFSVSTVAGNVYQLRCTGDSTACQLSAYDPMGVLVDSGSGLLAVRATGGTWHFVVSGVSSRGTGSYSLALSNAGVDDHSDVPVGATALSLGTPASGNIQFGGDADVFSFATTAPRLYRIACVPNTGVNYVCGLTVRDGGGASVATSSATGSGVLVVKAPSSATFTVAASSAGDTYLGAYTITVTDEGLDDWPDSPITATPIMLGTGYMGDIDYAGEDDVVSFTTIANHVHRLTCSSSSSQLCVVTLRNAVGATVGGGVSSGGTTTYLFFTAGAETWTAQFSGGTTTTGAYSFQVTDQGLDDHPNTAVSAMTFAPGTANGALQYAGDVDVMTFAVTAGRFYNFNVISAPGGFHLAVRDAGGALVRQSAASGTASVGFIAGSSGTWTVAFSSTTSGVTGSFSVVLSDGLDDAPNSASGAPVLTLGTSRNARLEYIGDEDWFAVALTAGTSYDFSVTTSFGTLYHWLYGPNGTSLVGGTSIAPRTYVPTATGTYFMRVQHSSANAIGDYSVRVQ